MSHSDERPTDEGARQTQTNALALARARSGLTVRKLATASGVDPSTISQLENGKRRGNLGTLSKLAEVLGIEISALAALRDHTASERGRLGAAAGKRKQTPTQAPPPPVIAPPTSDRPTARARQARPRKDKVGWWIFDAAGDTTPAPSKAEAERLAAKFKIASLIYGPFTYEEAFTAYRHEITALSNKGIDWRRK